MKKVFFPLILTLFCSAFTYWGIKLEKGIPLFRPYNDEGINIIGVGNVWHSALFSHFDIIKTNGIFKARYIRHEIDGNTFSDATKLKKTTRTINCGWSSGSFDISDFETLNNEFEDSFEASTLSSYPYYNPNLYGKKDQIESILSTSNAFCQENDIWWTIYNMIDKNWIWLWRDSFPWGWYLKSWNAKFSMMDDVRCDAMVEYAYEKNDIYVARGGYYIGHSGDTNLEKHNDTCLNTYTYESGETCPKQQAGELGNDSHLVPLVSEVPEMKNFYSYSSNLLSEYNEPCYGFSFQDDISDKIYMSIQAFSKQEIIDNVTGEGNYIRFKTLIPDVFNIFNYYTVKYRVTNLYYNSDDDVFRSFLHFKSSFEDGNLISPYGNRIYYKVLILDQGGNISTYEKLIPPDRLHIKQEMLSDQEQMFFSRTLKIGDNSIQVESDRDVTFIAMENIKLYNNTIIRPSSATGSIKLKISNIPE
ncbi:MAG: hypothetical protein RBT49_14315 [Bacteroidales bacterium]|jgi:hypothetical protein|nr:hypothetical protein [Bacteroidales bacterium]